MKEISLIAIAGMLATTFTVIIVCIFSVISGDSSAEHQWVEVDSYPYAFSSFVFAFGGHNVFPTIQDTMRSKKNFDKMLNWSFFVILLLYLPPCVFGYLYFGKTVQSPILLSIGTGYVSQMATIAITLHIWFTLPIVNNPLNIWLEELKAKYLDKKSNVENSIEPIDDNPLYPVLWRIFLRTCIMAFQALIACTVPHFSDVMAFIGASTVSATIFFCRVYFT